MGEEEGWGIDGCAPGSGGGCGAESTTVCLHRRVGGGVDIGGGGGGAGAGDATAIREDRQADLACQWLYVDQATDVGCLGTGRWRAPPFPIALNGVLYAGRLRDWRKLLPWSIGHR